MTQLVNFNDRDIEGFLIGKGSYQFTSNVVGDNGSWTQVQIGGPNNVYPVIKFEVTGDATSPASLSANPKDKILYLEVKHVPRGAPSSNGSGYTIKHSLIKWKDGETSTQKSIEGVREIFLNTSGRVDGNMFIRLVAEQGGTTFSNVDINVYSIGLYSNTFSTEAITSTTNNLYATAGNGNANTVNEIPASTLGYIECDFTQFGYQGDIKLSNRVGLSPSTEIGSSPKYYWEYASGDATGNTPWATAMHDGVAVASDIVCEEGDTLRVNRAANGTITYLKNGVIQGTGGSTDTVAMRGDMQLVNSLGRALGVRMDIGAGAISPTFENLSNIDTY